MQIAFVGWFFTAMINQSQVPMHQSEPSADACEHLIREFFRVDTFRLLIVCLPKLGMAARIDATHVVANLQRQRVDSKYIAANYLENNFDLIDILILGYDDGDIALTYGAIARECIRHQSVAKYVLESPHVKKFFNYLQIPNFNVASDAQATFKELLTKHKSTVAEFLSVNYDWFFQEYNSELLESPSYITRRHALKLLGDMLLDRSNSAVMDSNKNTQSESFHVFKLFVANQNKPHEILSILISNRSKFLRIFGDFKTDKVNEEFEADKSLVMREIASLELGDQRSHTDL
ncbi:hypothetical protein Pint_01889 [Pistacia integerrima]|uniref:Uncharacterized protein n=1 Tax=Pistacia integerrima TaxID=434235 RepID=A0ACC0ZN65_9ROSI|nr:hypothetical protein Pint_01889 [Pistacia integerrima]